MVILIITVSWIEEYAGVFLCACVWGEGHLRSYDVS